MAVPRDTVRGTFSVGWGYILSFLPAVFASGTGSILFSCRPPLLLLLTVVDYWYCILYHIYYWRSCREYLYRSQAMGGHISLHPNCYRKNTSASSSKRDSEVLVEWSTGGWAFFCLYTKQPEYAILLWICAMTAATWYMCQWCASNMSLRMILSWDEVLIVCLETGTIQWRQCGGTDGSKVNLA